MELVRGKCPRGCGSTLFLGDGGYVTCSWFACPEPDAASTVLLSLGSDETGAKPADVHAPLVAQPSGLTDSSPSSREARHGVAQALVDRVRRGFVKVNARGEFLVPTHRSDLNDAEAALEAMLVLIDELADRLYAATARSRA